LIEQILVYGAITGGVYALLALAVAFGTKPGDPRWQMEADINGDGTINIIDIAAVAKDFGKSVSLPLP